jgi:hypothetical protein
MRLAYKNGRSANAKSYMLPFSNWPLNVLRESLPGIENRLYVHY